MLCPTEATVTQQDSQYAAMAAMSEEERDDYLMELLEQYWAGKEDSERAKERREWVRSFRRPQAVEEDEAA